MNTFFPTLLEIPQARCIQLFTEAFELFRHAKFQLIIIICKRASSWCILQQAKEMENGDDEFRLQGRQGKTVHPTIATATLVHNPVCGLALSCSRET